MRKNCTKVCVPKERRRTAIQVTFSRTAPVGFELGFDFISFGIVCRWVRMGSKYERRMDEKSLQLWIATAWAPLAAARSNMRRFSCILTAVDLAKVWRSVEQRLANGDWRCNRVVRCGREPMRRIYKMEMLSWDADEQNGGRGFVRGEIIHFRHALSLTICSPPCQRSKLHVTR